MRALLVAMMLALAAVGFVALAAQPAAADPPCDLSLHTNCCIYTTPGFERIWWEPC